MVWAMVRKYQVLLKQIEIRRISFEIRPTEHEFTPHITLGRIIQCNLRE
jgi:2'-5' RNA ligase